MTIAYLGSLKLNGSAVDPDADGDIFTFKDCEGWEAATAGAFVDTRNADGDVAVAGRWGSRPMVLKGHCKAPQRGGVWRLRRKLTLAAALVYAPATLKIEESTVHKQASVWRPPESNLRYTQVGPYVLEFEIPLVATDPFKYATTVTQVTLTGSNSITNNGDGYSPPQAVVTAAAASGLTIQNTSLTGSPLVKLNGSVPSGAIIDFEKLTVFNSAGSDIYAAVVPDPATRWWRLQPGANTIVKSGSGSVRLDYRDAYL